MSGPLDASPVNSTQSGHYFQVRTAAQDYTKPELTHLKKGKPESSFINRCCKQLQHTSILLYNIVGTSEIDQLYKIASILGTPGRNDWPEGYSLATAMSFRFPTFQPTHLSQVLGSRSSARAVSFLYALLSWNPSWRSSAQEALRHSFFRTSNNNNSTNLAGLSNNLANSDEPNLNDAQAAESSMLSLSLGPTKSLEKEIIQPGPNNRLPLQLAEIEPHFSRDLTRSIKQEERPKTPPQPAPQPLQPQEELKDDDLNDLISAFSLEAAAPKSNRMKASRGKLFILSPAKTRVAKIEPLEASPALRIPRRHHIPGGPRPNIGGPQANHRTFQLQNAYHSPSGGLNFSPTTTKFTLLYGHHQPTTIKIVSPAKLGLGTTTALKASDSENKSKIEDIMGKRVMSKFLPSANNPANNHLMNQAPVFRSLPDFSSSNHKKLPNNSSLTPTKKSKPFSFAGPQSININGKGIASDLSSSSQQDKPRMQVRPDWAAKYLK